MKAITLTGLAAAGCLLAVSCQPWDETRNKPTPPPGTEKAKEKTEAVKKKTEATTEELKPKKKEKVETSDVGAGETDGPDEIKKKEVVSEESPKPAEKKRDYPVASKVPGQDGFVLSPYNNRKIDVRGMESGKLVSDPLYPASEKKYFRVP